MIDKIGRKMIDVLDRYARENGYVAILDPPRTCRFLRTDKIDVTQDIIKLYDQAYPLKAGTTPAKPAAKPAAQSTTPKAGDDYAAAYPQALTRGSILKKIQSRFGLFAGATFLLLAGGCSVSKLATAGRERLRPPWDR